MQGIERGRVRVYAHGKEPAWAWFWRCHGWRLLRRVIAALVALELIGLLGVSLASAGGVLQTCSFILALAPLVLAALIALAVVAGFVISLLAARQSLRIPG